MRRFYGYVILLSVGYFILGWGFVYLGYFEKSSYLTYSGIVGAFASVTALLSLTRPAVTQSDLQAIEASTLKSFAETSEQLKKLEGKHAQTREAIVSLEVTKSEMELLVKKASLALFLKERLSYYERQALEEIEKNMRLKEALQIVQDTKNKLNALDEEIETSPHVSQLKDIIQSATRRKITADEFEESLPPFSKTIVKLSRAISEAILGIARF